MADLNTELNRLAGTTGLDAQAAANTWAGTTGLSLNGALNHIINAETAHAASLVRTISAQTRTATSEALPACTYANGVLGVGATLTGDEAGPLPTLGGVTAIATDRVLVRQQAAGAQNGIYVVTEVGVVDAEAPENDLPFVLTRATDCDALLEIPHRYTLITEGDYAGTAFYVNSAGPYVMGTTAIVWSKWQGPAEHELLGALHAIAGIQSKATNLDVLGTLALLT